MLYKIIITKDGKKKKVLYEGSNENTAKEKYFTTKDKNIVLFPKKNNAYKKVKPVHYEIMFLKEKEDSDSPFYVRDELGRNEPVDIKSDKWSLVHKDDFFYEEKFTVYSYDERLETKDIIKKILLRRNKGDKIKQVNYIINKVLIYQNGDFDVVVCKNPSDARRLYKTLREFCETNKVNNIMFTGLVGKRNRTKLYKRIVEKTGWTINKTYRSSTRP
tara:strand:+ start:11938 stop:12588 length:651 start_codon:yes stop_codon:yes gene_type:complete